MKKIFAELLSILLAFDLVKNLFSYTKQHIEKIKRYASCVIFILGILAYIALFIMLALQEKKEVQSDKTTIKLHHSNK